MFFLFGFVLIVAAISAVAVWPRIGGPPAAAHPWRTTTGDAPTSAEGILAARLADGEITHRDYVKAMEHLAAGDAQRHPLVVPPEL